MSKKTVSIIVPCYNVEKYLPRCLDSLLSQTFDDLELICVNDGSTDGTLSILRSYEVRYPGLFVIIDKENGGAWSARQAAIAIAKGEYIGSLDGDDCAEPDFIEKLYAAAKAEDADIAVCGFSRIEDESNKTLSVEMCTARASFDVEREPQRLLELNGALWNKLFKTDLLRSAPDLKASPEIFEDMFLQLLIFPRAKRVVFVPVSLVNYMVHSGSIMTTIDKSKISSTYQAMLEVKRVYLRKASGKLLYFLDAAAFLHLGLSLMFRISYDKSANLKDELRRNRAYLDKNFPTWNTNKIISVCNARTYKGALRKTYYGRIVYSLGLMGIALQAYRAIISAGHDIKW